MNIKSLLLMPFLSLFSLCEWTPTYYGVGDIHLATYDWGYDYFGYEVFFMAKQENVVSLRILKSAYNDYEFGIEHNSAIVAVDVNKEEIESVIIVSPDREIITYPVDFLPYNEELAVAYIDIEFNTADFSKLDFRRPLLRGGKFFWLPVSIVLSNQS